MLIPDSKISVSLTPVLLRLMRINLQHDLPLYSPLSVMPAGVVCPIP